MSRTGCRPMWELLRARFAPPAWALLFEVRNGTGYARAADRYADAVAMSLWPSHGLELHGIEIKASRSDWARERKDPEKAEAFAAYCDRWWLAVTDEKIVADGELPPNWGLLAVRGGKLVAVKAAEKLTPAPMDRLLLAALLRRATEDVIPVVEADAARAELVAGEVAKGLVLAKSSEQHDLVCATNEARELRERIARFEAASGVEIDRWSAERSGEAVAVVRALGVHGLTHHARNAALEARRFADGVTSAADALDKAMRLSATARPDAAPSLPGVLP